MGSLQQSQPVAQRSQRRALLYDRVSTANQAKGGHSGGEQGFQLDLCRAHAERKDYAVIGHRSDVDSGAKWDVDGLIAAIEMAKRGEYDVLVVADSGRFARNLAKKLVYEGELRRHGVRVEYTNLPVDDTAEGRLVANMFGAYDEYEREKITWRLTNGRLNKAKGGQYVGNGLAPYGYTLVRTLDATGQRMVVVGLAINSDQAPTVERIFREGLTSSCADIAAGLNRDGVESPNRGGAWKRAGRWTGRTVYDILSNPAYKGQATFGRPGRSRREVAQGIVVPVPALVNPHDWAAVQDSVGERRIMRRGRYTPEDDPYELRGLLRCGHCGGVLSTDRCGPGSRDYGCLRHDRRKAAAAGWDLCSLPRVNAPALERAAWDAVTTVLLSEDKLRAGLRADREANAEEWATQRIRLEILDGEISKHERLLRRAAEEKLKVEADEPEYELHAEAAMREAHTLKRLREERTSLANQEAPGLSNDQADALERFAAEVRAGITNVTPEERRRIFQLIRLRATLTHDPEHGTKLASTRYTIAWDSLLPLSDSAGTFLKVRIESL